MGMRQKNPTGSNQGVLREVAIGMASVAIISGLLATPYGIPRASAATQGDTTMPEVTETYVGATELTAEEAVERAEAAEEESVPEEGIAENQLIVELFPGTDEGIVMSTITDGTGMKVAERLMDPDEKFGGMYLVSVPSDMELNEARSHILENTQVKSASYDMFLQAESTTPSPYANDPKLTNKWEDNADFLDFQGTWDEAYAAGWRDSSNVTVAVFDSGLTSSHEDLRDNIAAMHDATASHVGMADMLPNGHGTAVAGIVSARTGNGIGTASLAYNAKILPIQVFSRDNANNVGSLCSDIARGMNWLMSAGSDGVTPAEKYRVKVANLSLGSPVAKAQDPNAPSVITAINRLWDNGIIVVNSIGNKTSYPEVSFPYRHWPTSAANCVGVISLERESSSSTRVKREVESNYNVNASTIDARVSAPGYQIYTTASNGGYTDSFSGTSAAAPQVSSLLALMYSIYPNMTVQQATSALYNNTKPTIENNVMYTGNGMINPKAAVIETLSLKRQSNPSTSDLSGLSCDVGGEPYKSFNYRLSNFNIDCGTVATDPDTTVTFHGRPALWTQSNNYTQNSNSVTQSDGSIITTHTAKRSITFTSANTNIYTGDQIRQTYNFNFTWKTVGNDPNFPIVNQLANLKASAGGSELSGFNYQTTDYSKNYGTIPLTQSLPGSVTFANLGTWTVTADPSNPTTDTVTSSVASDGTTTGNKTRTLKYTLSATGANGQPLTRLYTFNFSGRYVDESTKYTTVLQDARLLIDGQPYDKFSSTQTNYAIEKPDQASFDAVSQPSFDNLPAGWTQATTGPVEGVETIDKGNGKSLRRASKKYVTTLSKGNAHVPYTVTFYLDTEIDNPSGESTPDDGNGQDQGGQASDKPQETQQPSNTNTQQGNPSSRGNQPTGNATGSQQGTQQGQRTTTGNQQLQQTGDATVPVALTVAASAIVAIIATNRTKARRKA